MNNSRILGNNILLKLKEKNLGIDSFSREIGLSKVETRKLIEGRMFLPPFQIKKIANVLGVSLETLTNCRDSSAYDNLIHNFGAFNNVENRELVLDFIDMYADLEETLQ